jgi:hypothetical protein
MDAKVSTAFPHDVKKKLYFIPKAAALLSWHPPKIHQGLSKRSKIDPSFALQLEPAEHALQLFKQPVFPRGVCLHLDLRDRPEQMCA